MEIGVALPTMARGYDRCVMSDWCAGIDAGPFSSISCGERITYHNPEMMVTLGGAAALTERVRVFVNLVVAPMHPPAMVAKQIATLQVLSGGRITLGVGVGGREHDYRAMGSPFDHRHARLDGAVTEIRALLAGDPPFDGADPVGPFVGRAEPVDSDGASAAGIEVLAGAMGPRALQRAARWADGISGFTLSVDAAEMGGAVYAARQAWSDAGRRTGPRVVSGCFYVLGGRDPAETLRSFTYDYLEIFGPEVARMFSEGAPVWNADRLVQALDDAADAGVDEFILVPGTVDPTCLDETVRACTAWLDHRRR